MAFAPFIAQIRSQSGPDQMPAQVPFRCHSCAHQMPIRCPSGAIHVPIRCPSDAHQTLDARRGVRGGAAGNVRGRAARRQRWRTPSALGTLARVAVPRLQEPGLKEPPRLLLDELREARLRHQHFGKGAMIMHTPTPLSVRLSTTLSQFCHVTVQCSERIVPGHESAKDKMCYMRE